MARRTVRRVTIIKPTKAPPRRRPPRRQTAGTQIERSTVMLTAPQVTVANTVYPFASQVIKLNAESLAKTGAARLASFMELYDEFKFVGLTLRWEPALPCTTTGQMAMYYDPDPGAELPAQFEQVSGNKFLRVGHVAKAHRLAVPSSVQSTARFNWFTRKKTDEQGTQGAIVMAFTAGTVPHAQGKVVLGSLWLDYAIKVRAPTSKTATATAKLIEWPAQPDIQYNLLTEASQVASCVGHAAGQNVVRTWETRQQRGALPTIEEEYPELDAIASSSLASELAALRNDVSGMIEFFRGIKLEMEAEGSCSSLQTNVTEC